jgi:hypothetical protein
MATSLHQLVPKTPPLDTLNNYHQTLPYFASAYLGTKYAKYFYNGDDTYFEFDKIVCELQKKHKIKIFLHDMLTLFIVLTLFPTIHFVKDSIICILYLLSVSVYCYANVYKRQIEKEYSHQKTIYNYVSFVNIMMGFGETKYEFCVRLLVYFSLYSNHMLKYTIVFLFMKFIIWDFERSMVYIRRNNRMIHTFREFIQDSISNTYEKRYKPSFWSVIYFGGIPMYTERCIGNTLDPIVLYYLYDYIESLKSI